MENPKLLMKVGIHVALVVSVSIVPIAFGIDYARSDIWLNCLISIFSGLVAICIFSFKEIIPICKNIWMKIHVREDF